MTKNTKKQATKKHVHHFFVSLVKRIWKSFFVDFCSRTFQAAEFFLMFLLWQETPRDNPLQMLQPGSRYVQKPAADRITDT